MLNLIIWLIVLFITVTWTVAVVFKPKKMGGEQSWGPVNFKISILWWISIIFVFITKISPFYFILLMPVSIFIISYFSGKAEINFALKKIKSDKTLNSLTNIAGGESAGIPYASLLAQKLKLPLSYIRKERKKFGKQSQIEGDIKAKDNVLIAEDLITDGKSKYNFIDAVEKVGGRIKAIFVVFNYGINSDFLEYKGKKIKIISLAKWEDVLNILISKKVFPKKKIKLIVDFLSSMGIKNLKSFL